MKTRSFLLLAARLSMFAIGCGGSGDDSVSETGSGSYVPPGTNGSAGSAAPDYHSKGKGGSTSSPSNQGGAGVAGSSVASGVGGSAGMAGAAGSGGDTSSAGSAGAAGSKPVSCSIRKVVADLKTGAGTYYSGLAGGFIGYALANVGSGLKPQYEVYNMNGLKIGDTKEIVQSSNAGTAFLAGSDEVMLAGSTLGSQNFVTPIAKNGALETTMEIGLSEGNQLSDFVATATSDGFTVAGISTSLLVGSFTEWHLVAAQVDKTGKATKEAAKIHTMYGDSVNIVGAVSNGGTTMFLANTVPQVDYNRQVVLLWDGSSVKEVELHSGSQTDLGFVRQAYSVDDHFVVLWGLTDQGGPTDKQMLTLVSKDGQLSKAYTIDTGKYGPGSEIGMVVSMVRTKSDFVALESWTKIADQTGGDWQTSLRLTHRSEDGTPTSVQPLELVTGVKLEIDRMFLASAMDGRYAALWQEGPFNSPTASKLALIDCE